MEAALLKTGPAWTSFEDFRAGYADNLAQISEGEVGTLKVKKRHYAILNSADYARLQTTLQEVGQLQEQIDTFLLAADVASTGDTKAVALMSRILQSVKEDLERVFKNQ